ncbi:MAG TPA: efflux RND transporter periplasmic adaptor subunit [Verrucomicrobiae bacterium]|nr:efflux RND transporter periplasmic adaptor subunit [Verrucomicrobiae bacterium]
MKKRKIRLFSLAAALVVGAVIYCVAVRPAREIVLTGIVTTDEVIVSPQIQGRLERVLVREGDAVTNGDLLAVIQPQTEQADMAFYENSERSSASQVTQAEADLNFQEAQTSNQVSQAEANLAAAQAQAVEAEADLENARLTFERQENLHNTGVESQQTYDQARTTYDAGKARLDAAEKQSRAAAAAVEMAKSNSEQVAARHAAFEGSRHQLAAAGAQKEKAKVQLGYTEIRSPLNGIVDTRVALPGEVVNPGQAIVTLIDEDNLWVRADVEESYIDSIHRDDKLQVKLPSGATREGTVFFRGVDADYATQRDVSRTKRDIRTFEIRLRCDNRDRSLAVGMTAYVALPLIKKPAAPRP